MNILGISCFYHESAAALIRDGEIVASGALERFSRKKHDASFPQEVIDFCLKEGNISVDNLDYVVFYEKPFPKFERNLTMSLAYFPKSHLLFVDAMKNFLTEKLWIKSIIASKLNMNPERILFIPHHISHAAASYFTSPFDNAAFLTLDGVGEWTSSCWGEASQNKLYPKQEIRFPNSVGLIYATFTAFCGFEVNDGEYKLMGMAGYGKPIHIDKIKKLYKQYSDGSIALNLEYFAFHWSPQKMYTSKFQALFKELNPADIAASIQACTEEIVFIMLSYIYKKTKQKQLVFGGGVALNSSLNGKIVKSTPFKDLFIFPAAGDDGGAVGAALYVYHHVLGNPKKKSLSHVFFGKEFTGAEIEQVLKKENIQYRKLAKKKLIEYAVGKLIKGNVIGWFEGRAEFGPRALGHRSILADPRNQKMKDIVNKKIKFREEFRPFAPAVLTEHGAAYFDINASALVPFMLATCRVKPSAKKDAPATVHVDGTSRIQRVDKDYDGRFYELLTAFYKKTSVPILLNTSFNVKGEPIVNSPKDALNTFRNSGIDVLVLEDFIIEKQKII